MVFLFISIQEIRSFKLNLYCETDGMITNVLKLFEHIFLPWYILICLFFLVFGVIFSCQQQPTPLVQPENHQLMTVRLNSFVCDAQLNPFNYFNANQQRAKRLETDLRDRQITLDEAFELIMELHKSKEVGKSLPILDQIGQMRLTVPYQMMMLNELTAVSFLRLDTIINCIEKYDPNVCTLPSGEHEDKLYVEALINRLEVLMVMIPESYTLRWLYNLAHISNGTYPDAVTPRFRIENLQSPEQLPEDLPVPEFQNIGTEAGVADNQIAGGVCIEDFNGNGRLDIVTTSYGLDHQVRYYVSDGKGGYDDQTEAAGLKGIVSGLNIECADINNSGYPDLFITRGAWLGVNGRHPNSLLRNNGDNTFTDITLDAGLYEEAPTHSAAFADITGNGYVDLFVGNESGGGWMGGAHGDELPEVSFPSSLYLNNGDETFTRIEIESLKVDGFVKGSAWGDINNNGWPDLYVSVMGEQNKLFVHRGLDENGLPQFEEIAEQAGVSMPQFGFPVWFWDYNNNGLLDILVLTYDVRNIMWTAEEVARERMGLSVYAEHSRLYKNMGDETFLDVTEEANLDVVMFAMGANFGDVNNNGYPDIYVGTGAPDPKAIIPNRLFLNDGKGRFHESTFKSRVGHLAKGHGVSFADLNGNGALDIYIVLGGAFEGDHFPNALYKNQFVPENWLTLILEGTNSNRQGIGARVEAVYRNDDAFKSFYRTVSTGGSFGSNNSRVHFSFEMPVGNVDSLKIHWPAGGGMQVLTNVATNRVLTIREDDINLE